MEKRNFITKGFVVVAKFILVGLIAMCFVVVVKNRMDLLSFSIALIGSFVLGGISMAISLAKEIKSLIRENYSLKRQLKKAKKEIVEVNETLENIPIYALLDFNESINSNKTA